MNSTFEEINRLFELGKIDEIPNLISHIESPIEKLMLELKLLTFKGDYSKVISFLENSSISLEGESNHIISSIFFYLANAYWELDEVDLSKAFLKIAIENNRENEDALWLRREIYGTYSKINKHFSVIISGCWEKKENNNEVTFFSRYEVVAETIQKALVEIIEFEIDDLDKKSFKIEEYETFETAFDNPSGVYETNAFHLHDSEEK